MEPKISIVVLNWNGVPYLNEVIPKLLNINYPNKEIIVVDNNSQDGSKEALKKFNGITVVANQENFGYSRGKNIGVQASHGEFVYLLDNDIVVPDQEILKKLLKSYNTHEKVAFLCPVLIDSSTGTSTYYQGSLGYNGIQRVKPIAAAMLQASAEQTYKTQYVTGGNIFFKKSIWNLLRGYDEVLPFNIDDYDISVRSHIYGFQNFMMINHPLNIHIGSTAIADKKVMRWKFRNLLAGQLITNLKNYSPINFLIISAATCIRILLVTLKKSLISKDFLLTLTFPMSIILFIQKIPHALAQRKIIQHNRKNSDHSLLAYQIKYNF